MTAFSSLPALSSLPAFPALPTLFLNPHALHGQESKPLTPCRQVRIGQAVYPVGIAQPARQARPLPWYSQWWSVLAVFAATVVVLMFVEAFFYATSPVVPHSHLCKRVTDRNVFRNALAHDQGFASCAVVGSAGFLRLQRLGAEIDRHDFVIRANLAPVSGYEPVAGSKTSMRVLNSEAIGTIFKEKGCPRTNSSACPDYPVYLNTGDQWMVDTYRRLCPDSLFFDNRHLNAWDPMLHAQWQGLGTNLMSGAYALAIASKLCPNGTTVYGVSHAGSFEFNKHPNASYHYFDARPQSAWDSLPSSAQALSNLAETQGECMQLHTPAAAMDQFPLPTQAQLQSRALSDPLVDDLKHDLPREIYLDHRQILAC